MIARPVNCGGAGCGCMVLWVAKSGALRESD